MILQIGWAQGVIVIAIVMDMEMANECAHRVLLKPRFDSIEWLKMIILVKTISYRSGRGSGKQGSQP